MLDGHGFILLVRKLTDTARFYSIELKGESFECRPSSSSGLNGLVHGLHDLRPPALVGTLVEPGPIELPLPDLSRTFASHMLGTRCSKKKRKCLARLSCACIET